jgi:hypothetical protein
MNYFRTDSERYKPNFVTITILDIIHRSFFYLKHNISETDFCLRLQVNLAHLDPRD